jgi:hypothetical protein
MIKADCCSLALLLCPVTSAVSRFGWRALDVRYHDSIAARPIGRHIIAPLPRAFPGPSFLALPSVRTVILDVLISDQAREISACAMSSPATFTRQRRGQRQPQLAAASRQENVYP